VAHRVLDRDEILTMEPALEAGGKEIVGAVLFPDDETGDARMFTRAVADLAEDAGVAFRLNTSIEAIESAGDRITGVRTSAGRLSADAYLLALGSYSPILARPLGLRLPVYPVKGYSLTAPLDGWNGAPRLPLVDEALKVGLIPLGNRLRIAGSAELAGYDLTPQARRADYVWRNAVQVYPDLARYVDRASIQPWAGLRPVTSDGPPILGPTRFGNLFLNTGHGHLGWTMACGSARAVADVIAGRAPEIDLQGLTAARFA
jgi:D-amino-acid dehydrogenase